MSKYLKKSPIGNESLRQKYIMDVVNYWINKYPEKYEETKKRANDLRSSRANKYGSDIKKEYRFEFTFPTDLYNMLDKSLENPKFLKLNSEADWFRKTFPQFAPHETW